MQGRPHQDLSCFILDLAPGWSAHADPLQWLLCRKRHRLSIEEGAT